MIIYLWIALGSALGGMARYACQVWAARVISDTFPWGTLLVNIAGCSFIGFFATFTGPDGRIVIGLPPGSS
nr:CrcB protein [uncultured bacterium]